MNKGTRHNYVKYSVIINTYHSMQEDTLSGTKVKIGKIS